MGELWTPPGSRPARWERIRAGDRTLGDGRELHDLGPCGPAVAEWGRAWRSDDGLAVIASEDTTAHGNLLHVSLSRPDRLPAWDDVLVCRDAFFGSDIDCAMMLPRSIDYVNVHQFALHLWQPPTVWGLR
jgi:hypothetical protein